MAYLLTDVVQSVTLRFTPAPRIRPVPVVQRNLGNMPQIGLVIAPEEIPDALRHIDLLAKVAPQRILCHLDPTAGHGGGALAGFAALQAAYPAEYDLEYVVTCDREDEMARLAEAVAASGLRLANIAVCPSVDLHRRGRSGPIARRWRICTPQPAPPSICAWAAACSAILPN